ncbi:MAG TPA: peptidyl-prolyl cis-trans isomerase [Terriglobales bacterium]|nr:peptidyl-prolyl cis-trans isomerase [Terriglobales bacterium]
MIRFLQSSGKAKKVILGGLLLIICGAMVITLVPGGMLGDAFGFGGVEGGVLAKIGAQEVTVAEVDATARRMGRQQFGGRSVPSALLPMLRQSAAEQLVTQKALLAEAEHMGLKVTSQELQQALSRGQIGQYLFPNGQFVGEQQYEMFVNQQFQLTIPQFEQLVKNDLLLNKLRLAVEGPVAVSKSDVEEEYRRQNTKVKLEYATLSLEDVMKQVKPTEADLKSYYESHKESYANSIPEKRQVKYAVVDTAQIANQVQVTQADLQRYYRDNQDLYRVPEQVNVRHILIKTPLPGPDGKTDDNAVKAAKQKAEDVLSKIKAGGNFADLAKKNSEDEGSAKNGGDLGWINRGQTVPEFEKVAFSLKKGETSGLVQSSYGFHIIQLIDRHDAHVKSLDEVKAQIEPILRQQKAADAAENSANQLLSQAKAQGLEKAAQAKGLEVITSNLITRTDTLPGVGTAPQLMDAIFSAAPKGAPEMIATPQGSVVFQVTEVKPPATPSFDEIRARVESEYKSDKAQQLLAQRTMELSEKAKAEHSVKKAAQQVGANFKTSDFVSPSSQVPDLGRMADAASVAFSLKNGEVSGPINTGRGGAVLMVVDKQEPTAEELAKGNEQIRQALLERKRAEVFQVFAAGLRQRLESDKKIRKNQKEWNRIMSASSELPGQ